MFVFIFNQVLRREYNYKIKKRKKPDILFTGGHGHAIVVGEKFERRLIEYWTSGDSVYDVQ